MITETFLNSCFSIVLNKNCKIRKSKVLYRDIVEILSFYKQKKTIEIPVIVQNKFECLEKICNMKLSDKTDDNIIDSITFTKKYKDLVDFLDLKTNETLHENTMIDNIKQLRLRKRLNSLFSNYDQLKKFIDSYNEGTFDSIDDLVLDYESIVKQLYANMMESNRDVYIEASASLDLVKDDYDSVVSLIKKKYQRVNTTPTGFPVFDNDILSNGGFEPSRLYVLGGGSGSGKSTMLNNYIINCATSDDFNNRNNDNNDNDKNKIQNVFVYITLENTIEESLLRTYQALFEKSLTQVLIDINNGVDIKKKLQAELLKTNSTIVMKYFSPMSASVVDIMMELDTIISEYGKSTIKGLYVDYLDLLRTDMKFDLYRIELGFITLSLKTLAVQYNIPVVTVTQLGRSVYKARESGDLNLDMMSESIKKVEHADFIALMAKDPVDDNLVHMRVGKSRSGKSNINLDFSVNFKMYKFINGIRSVTSKKSKTNKQSYTSEQLIHSTSYT